MPDALTSTHHTAPEADSAEARIGADPQNWREALLLLLSSRTALIRLESAEAVAIARTRVLILGLLIMSAFFGWALLLAGGVAALAAALGCAWFWVAIAASMLHLTAIVVLGRALRKPTPPVFEATKAEFEKDREWILKI